MQTETLAADTPRPEQIAERIVDAILAGKLAPGARLGEQPLADLFAVSRTIVREALARLAARGMVEVNSRRGWFVVQPSRAAARDAFDARRAIETGLLHALPARLDPAAIKRLKRHLAQERAAIAGRDAGERSFMLGDFHVCLAECAGNRLLADILRDLTARTTLIATLYQSTHEAAESCAEHAAIVQALEAGDTALAVERMREHLHNVAQHLGPEAAADDPLAALRTALAAEAAPARQAARERARKPARKPVHEPAHEAAHQATHKAARKAPPKPARRPVSSPRSPKELSK